MKPLVVKPASMDEFPAVVGLAALVMAEVPALGRRDIAYFRDWVIPAIRHGQLGLFFDPATHRPVGLATWAYLAPDVEARILAADPAPLHDSEWKEGGNVWVIDLVSPFGAVRSIGRCMREQLFPDIARLHWRGHMSRRAAQPIAQVWTRAAPV